MTDLKNFVAMLASSEKEFTKKTDKRAEIFIPKLKHTKWIVMDNGDLVSTSYHERWEQRYNETISDWLRDYWGIVRKGTWE